MDKISEQRLAQVHPELAEKVRLMADTLAEQGIIIRVVQGLRTVAEQDALYAEGRTKPGKIVTKAKGGYSNHNFGLAVDVVPGIRGAATWTPNWDASHADYQAMAEVGKSVGLVWGGDWKTLKDEPHFQLANVPVTPTLAMRNQLAHAGMYAVWQEFSQEVTA